MGILQQRAKAALLIAASLLIVGCAKRPVHEIDVENPRSHEWSEAALEAAGSIPVQHLGRVKPLSTVAGFALLKTQGKRKFKIEEGTGLQPETLDPTGWLLDVLLFPEQAMQYEVFLVEDSDVLEGVGLRFDDRKRRDRYSYTQLAPARGKLAEAYQLATQKERDGKDLTILERQSRDLFVKMFEFEDLLATTDFARIPLRSDPPPRLRVALGDAVYTDAGGQLRLSAVGMLREREALGPAFEELRAGSVEQLEALDRFSEDFTLGIDSIGRASIGALHFTAPEVSADDREEWDAPGDVLMGATSEEEPRGAQLEVLGAVAAAVRERADLASVTAHLQRAQSGAQELAEARGQWSKVPLERSYYKRNFFSNALAVFLLGFVVSAIGWLAPGRRWTQFVPTLALVAGTVLVVWGVTVRCILLERPPVSTLYETILFITGTITITALLVRWLARSPYVVSLGTFLGAWGMFMANRYELRDAATGGDTLVNLQAVLDSNYWLATHVTTVTLGYSAGLLACFLAHLWLAARIFGSKRWDASWFRARGREIYGVVAFGLLFSVVGTILGGVWANDSWGRFWGWDPKENGALMICLFELMIVHSRLGGYIKDFGVALSCILLGPVVAFSWWHVNLLGVGLHSYGFTAGIKEWLFIYYAFELVVFAAAMTYLLMRRSGGGGTPATA